MVVGAVVVVVVMAVTECIYESYCMRLLSERLKLSLSLRQTESESDV